MPDGATVLDLACGDGELLAELVREKHVRGSGVDISTGGRRGVRRQGPVGLPRRPRRGPRRLPRRLARRRHPEPQPPAAAAAAHDRARDGARRPAGDRQLPQLRPLGRAGAALLPGPHAGLDAAALPVVGHAQHPPVHHQGLPPARIEHERTCELDAPPPSRQSRPTTARVGIFAVAPDDGRQGPGRRGRRRR